VQVVDLWKTLLVIVRRWYIALPMFLVSIGGAGAIFASYPSYYESDGLLILTSPTGGSVLATNPKDNAWANPLLSFDDGLKITATLLIQSLNAPPSMGQLVTPETEDSVTIGHGDLEGPFIAIKSTSASPEQAEQMVDRVFRLARSELQKQQLTLNAPPKTYINISAIVAPTPPVEQSKLALRAAGSAFAIGLAATLTVVYGTESFLSHRRKRRERAEAPAAEKEEPEEKDAEPEEPGGPREMINGVSLTRTRDAESGEDPSPDRPRVSG
jgi:hypothetical protein